MSINLIVNGTTYIFPEPTDVEWGQNVTDWANAVTGGMLQKAGGSFSLTAEVDFGGSFGLKSLYLKSKTSNPADAGIIRLAHTDSIAYRNNANSGNLLLAVDSSDRLTYNGSPIQQTALTFSDTSTIDLTESSSTVTADIVAGSITDSLISNSAAIAYSKLNLSNSILNADINSSAAIAYSKLNLSSSIVNADVSNSAAIAYSKLALSGSIVNSDISVSAAIDFSKLASLTSGNILLGNASNVVTSVAMSGDVTINNAGVTAVGSNKITNSQLAQMPTQTIKGNNTGGTANASDLSASQVTAMLNAFVGDSGSGGTKGLVPAPSAGQSETYLKGDGTWATVQSGGVNFITNATGESGTTGYAAYSNTAQASPVTGAGGSPSVTWTTSNSTPLSGNQSFLFTKDAANRQGQGVAYDFTIDNASKSKVLQIQFDYILSSGTFQAGGSSQDSDITVWVYDITNAVMIQPTTYKLFSNSSTTPDKFVSNFQTSANSNSYRLIFHVASTSSSAFSLKIDNVVVSPTTLSYGTPITDWQDFPSVAAGTLITATTTNPTYGTVATNKAQWRRVGGNAEIRWTFRQTSNGTTGSGTYLFNIPSVIGSIDTSRVTVSTDTNVSTWVAGTVGTFYYASDGSSFQGTGTVGAYSATQLKMMVSGNNGGVSAGSLASTVNSSFYALGSSTIAYGLLASVPIQGWSAQVQSSDVNDQRIVAAKYYLSTNTTFDTTTINYNTREIDTHNAVTTGASWRFTAPISGVYKVSTTQKYSSGVGTRIDLFKNGSTFAELSEVAGAPATNTSSSTLIELVAGDFISTRTSSAITLAGGVNPTRTTISIERVANPASITSTETVAASYCMSTNLVVNAGNRISYDTRIIDTHNAVTLGTSTWKFTAPVSGLYHVSFGACSGTGSAVPQLYKNGAYFRSLAQTSGAAINNNNVNGSTILRLNAGEDIYLHSSLNSVTYTVQAGVGATIQGSNYIDIYKIGI